MSQKIFRIKDIALKAGVSTGTVDRVLHKRGRVSKEAEEKVLKIIEEYNYEPNLIARALGNNKEFKIAVFIPDYEIDSYWESPLRGAETAEKEFRGFGISLKPYLFHPYQVNSFIEKAQEITTNNPDGILISPIFYREALPFLEEWKKKNIPFVFFNTQIADFDPLSYIGQDSFQSGLVAARLIHYGLTEGTIVIAHIDEESNNAAHLVKKEEGFRKYFRENKINNIDLVNVELNRTNYDIFKQQLDKLFSNHNHIKAFFITTSKAHDVAAYLKEKNIEGIKIVGYDLLQENIKFLESGHINFLINQNPKGQGYWGISFLVDYLIYKKEIPTIKYLPLDIVVKENLDYYLENHN